MPQHTMLTPLKEGACQQHRSEYQFLRKMVVPFQNELLAYQKTTKEQIRIFRFG